MANEARIVDKTKVFVGLQDEIRAGQTADSVDLRVHLDEAAAELAPYFDNADRIPTALGAGGLRFEHLFLRESAKKPWIDSALRMLLEEFRRARSIDRARCFQAWAEWMERTDLGIRNIAAVAALQDVDLDRHLELAAKSILRDLGDVLEGSLQPFARLRLDLRGVSGIRSGKAPAVVALSFGKVIEELCLDHTVRTLYCPAPFGLTVSQWRNIANHNDYRIEGNEVFCRYGVTGTHKEVRCTIQDLVELALYINDLYYVHKVAFEIFTIDNMIDLQPLAPKIRLTEHTSDGTLAYGIVTAGFSIHRVGYKVGSWAFVLEDELARPERAAKLALQDAMCTYMLLSGPVQIMAAVKSAGALYWFSFEGRISRTKGDVPKDFIGDIRKTDEFYRPVPSGE